jgi:hypothetical protein
MDTSAITYLVLCATRDVTLPWGPEESQSHRTGAKGIKESFLCPHPKGQGPRKNDTLSSITAEGATWAEVWSTELPTQKLAWGGDRERPHNEP